MSYDSRKRNRRSIRLPGYDYDLCGAYFITVCTRDKYHLFGCIRNKEMQLNELGSIARAEWNRSEEMKREIKVDEMIVMPNHIHGIVIIQHQSQSIQSVGAHGMRPSSVLCNFVRGYKGRVSSQAYRRGFLGFSTLWQRNYYDRVIRNEKELSLIREYIRNNPKNWESDYER